MTIKHLVLCTAIGLAMSQTALAADCASDAKPIDHIPFLISEAGNYCLMQDVSVSLDELYALPLSAALRIIPTLENQSFTINLNQKAISLQPTNGDSGGFTYGIAVFGTGSKITIQNGVIENFDAGIFGDGVGGSLTAQQMDMTITQGGYATGIQAKGFDKLNVSDTKIETPNEFEKGFGIYADNIRQVAVDNATIFSQESGIFVGNAETVSIRNSHMEMLDNPTAWAGIELYKVKNSTSTNNSISGFFSGIYYAQSNGAYSRTMVTVPAGGICFQGGTSVGLKNTCTIEP